MLPFKEGGITLVLEFYFFIIQKIDSDLIK